MRKWGVLAGVASAGVALAGCGSNTFTDRPARLELPPPPDPAVVPPGKAARAPKPTPADPEQRIIENFRATDPKRRDDMTPRQYRDSIIWRVVAKDDDSFNAFTRRVRSDRALMNMSADGGVIFLNGLAAVTGTAGEKAALAVLSGGLLGAKGSVDRQLFNQETMTALLARMKAARLEALVPIKRGLALSAELYPLEQALVDLRAYANAGSLLATVEAITTDAGAAADRAEVALERLGPEFAESVDRRDEVGERVAALKGRQLTYLATRMDGYLAATTPAVRRKLDAADERMERVTMPGVALTYLTTWLASDPRSGGAEWQDALTAAEKVKP